MCFEKAVTSRIQHALHGILYKYVYIITCDSKYVSQDGSVKQSHKRDNLIPQYTAWTSGKEKSQVESGQIQPSHTQVKFELKVKVNFRDVQ